MDASDKLAIHELLARTVFGLDQRDPAMIEACFTADASFTLDIKGADPIPPFEGRAAIMQLMIGSMNAHTQDRRHVVSNLFFESESAETAKVTSTLAAFHAEHGKVAVMTTGIYRDLVQKEDGRWKISRRHLSLDVPF